MLYPMQQSDRAYFVCKQLHEMNFSGNVIPTNWFGHLKTEKGYPNLSAAVVLSEIVYRYRPIEVREEGTEKSLGLFKQFEYDRPYFKQERLGDKFGLSRRQVQSALDCIEKIGVIKIEVKPVVRKGDSIYYNVMFVEIVPSKLAEITYTEAKPVSKPTRQKRGKKTPESGDMQEDADNLTMHTSVQALPITQAMHTEVQAHAHQSAISKITDHKITKRIGAAPPTPPTSAVQPSLFDTTALTPESGDMQDATVQTNCEHILDATPKQDATSRRVASKGKQKVAKVDDQPKRKVSEIAQAIVYRDVFGKWPNLNRAEYLEKNCPDCERLRQALNALELTTDNRCNFFLIVKLYNQGATPESETQAARNGNGYNHGGVTARNTTNNRNGYSRHVEPVEHYGEDESLRRASELALERRRIEQQIAAERASQPNQPVRQRSR